MTTTRYRNTEEHFPRMMKLSEEIGCQLKPSATNPAVLNGLCPFHESDSLRGASTLSIDTQMLRFWCAVCEANGNPLAFIARVWGTSARDTYKLIQHQVSKNREITADRPAYPEEYFKRHRETSPIPQNTALLTRASKYYAKRMLENFEPLHFLAQLGIHPSQAAKIGVGYSTGKGLKEYLSQYGFSQEEIDNSPLFHQSSDLEVMTERITIADRDYTGAAMWITSILPQEPDENRMWSERRPKTYGIKEIKPYLMNNMVLTRRHTNAVITEDARFYIVLAANQISCILIHQMENDISRNTDLVLNELRRKDLDNLGIAMHHREARRRIGTKLPREIQGVAIRYFTRNDIMNVLNVQTRDLQEFQDFIPEDNPTPGQARRRTSREKTTPRTESKNSPEKETQGPDPTSDKGSLDEEENPRDKVTEVSTETKAVPRQPENAGSPRIPETSDDQTASNPAPRSNGHEPNPPQNSLQNSPQNPGDQPKNPGNQDREKAPLQ